MKAHRKVKDVPIYIMEPNVIEMLVKDIDGIEWNYTHKQTRELLIARDKALAALLALIGPRISEARALEIRG